MLSIVFFSIAAVNLGLTQSPTTTAQLTDGQSCYIDLGSSTSVKSMVFLLKQGAINVSISTGSPTNWQNNSSNSVWPYSSSSFSEDYYKWHEVSVDQTTQYLKLSFGPTGSYNSIIAEIAVVDQNEHQVTIQSISDLGSGNPNLHNLIDEQNTVQYPSDYKQNTYFDEIYFVRTAEQYLHSQLPYEWTHPPLGKLIQASSLLIFGFDPLGWRIMGVIFATLMIPLMFMLGKKLFGTWIGGFASAFLLTFDFMHFTMSRMGTADTYVIFFSLASQLFFLIYLKNILDKGWKTSIVPLFLAIMFAALGFSTKWLVLFGFAGQLVLLAAIRLSEVKNLKGNISAKIYAFLDRPYSAIVGFLLLALGIYFITYIPDMLAGRSFFDVLNLQGQMYTYQSTLKATHPYASPWYSWPFMFDPINALQNMFSSAAPSTLHWVHVPLWLEVASLPNGTESTIVLLGNPALWWVGFAVIVGLTIFYVPKLFKKNFSLKKNLPAIFIITFFFFQWLPYIVISRVVFIYHFYVNVPFLCLGSAVIINKYWNNKWAKVLAIAYFALVVALFVLFYPVISGVPTSTSTINSLKWFGSWSF